MMQAMGLSSPLVGSSFMSSPVIQSDRASSYGQSLGGKPHSLIVCELGSNKSSTSSVESSRRSLMIATVAGATAAAFITQPDSAQAAKRKPPPAPEEKKADEEKYLSAYDAKVLANIRRKEALKAQLETQKAKAKTVREPVKPSPDIFGQSPQPEQSPLDKLSQVPESEQSPVETFSQISE